MCASAGVVNVLFHHRRPLQSERLEYLANGLSENHQILHTYRGQSASKIRLVYLLQAASSWLTMHLNTLDKVRKTSAAGQKVE